MTVAFVPDSRALLEAIAATVLLVGVWLGFLAVRARLSGWAGLARTYRAHARPDGPEFRRQAARLNGYRFRRGVTVRTSPRGLYLQLARAWRFQHPSLLIPWAHISGPRPDTTFFGRYRFEFTLSDDPAYVVRLGEAAALEAKQYLPVPRMRYVETPSRVLLRAGAGGGVTVRANEPSRPPAVLDPVGERPTVGPAGSAQWIVTCTCGWTTRVASTVAADAAVIVHRHQGRSPGDHVTAYARYDDLSLRPARWPAVRPEQEPVPL
jgi:hypothetical protein